ncbi:hypothetical protein LP419_34140 [Massilia sp. H-1]|nr:hypothetical protein LP419_34140 [Massilia sp. H-1]
MKQEHPARRAMRGAVRRHAAPAAHQARGQRAAGRGQRHGLGAGSAHAAAARRRRGLCRSRFCRQRQPALPRAGACAVRAARRMAAPCRSRQCRCIACTTRSRWAGPIPKWQPRSWPAWACRSSSSRAVLLAQNEFSAFLKTEENERGELLGNAHRQHRLQRHLAPRLRALQAGTDGHATAHGAPGRPCAAAARGPRRTGNPVRRGRRGPGRGRRGAAGPGTAAALAPGVRQAASRPAAGRTGAGHGTRHGRHDAAGRRQHLALLDAVEPARPLAAECARLERETAAAAEAGSAAAAELQRVQAAQLQAAGALAAASAALQAAELAQQEARPGLDQAKALDASMAALAPSHASAAAARQGAQDELAQAAAALVSTQTKLAATGAEHRQAAEWLAAHAHWDTFAAQWPRWDTLLRQAAQAHAAGAGLAAELNGA